MVVEAPSGRVRVSRAAERARYESEEIAAILDDGYTVHVATVAAADGRPAIIPTAYVRVEDHVYVHASPASGLGGAFREGAAMCLAVTLLDGLVLARSAFHHSMNYRSVVVHGYGREVTDPDERERALRAFVERAESGRWDAVRRPTRKELAATIVGAVSLAEASAKVRAGPPVDDEADLGLAVWAGVVPLRLVAGEPVADSHPVAAVGPRPG
jgi:nitroimidazol reductase NimA-like FMN-containing flavoprotein (pyridoxamine 5'-phosphate oxidase superfamily)